MLLNVTYKTQVCEPISVLNILDFCMHGTMQQQDDGFGGKKTECIEVQSGMGS